MCKTQRATQSMNPCAVCLAVNDSGGGGNRKSRSRRAIRDDNEDDSERCQA